MRHAAIINRFVIVIVSVTATGGCSKEMLQPTSVHNDPAALAASWKSANVDPRWMKARTLITEAQTLARDRKYAEALPAAREAKVLFEQASGPQHPDVGKALLTVADIEGRLNDSAQAEQDAERAVAILEKHRGSDPDLDQTYATGLTVLAGVYWDVNKFAQAEQTYRRAIAAQEAVWGQDSLYVATTLTNLGQLYLTRGREAEAEPLLQKALMIREKALGANDPQVGMSVCNLALAKRALKKHEEAQPLEQRALGILKQTGDPTLQQHFSKYAQQLRNLGRDQDADQIDSQVRASGKG